MGLRTKREMAAFVAAILEASDRAAALRDQAELERSATGSSETAARAILRNRHRCGSVSNAGQEQETVRP